MINAYDANFKIGTKVKVFNPYGAFTYEDVVQYIPPQGRFVKVGDVKYYPKKKDYAEASLSCWGRGTIEIVK